MEETTKGLFIRAQLRLLALASAAAFTSAGSLRRSLLLLLLLFRLSALPLGGRRLRARRLTPHRARLRLRLRTLLLLRPRLLLWSRLLLRPRLRLRAWLRPFNRPAHTLSLRLNRS